MKLYEIFFCFVDYHSYTKDIQLYAIRIVSIICTGWNDKIDALEKTT